MATSDAAILDVYAVRPEAPRLTRWRRSLFTFARTKPLGFFGLCVVMLLLFIAAFPGLFATHSPTPAPPPILERLQGPSAEHWMGTDQFGRDVYSRIIYGARTSIVIGFLVVAVSAVIASFLGIVSGYFGGWFDILVQRLVDIGISLPGLIFIILVVTTLTQFPPSWMGLSPAQGTVMRIAVTLGILVALGSSRVIRGSAITVKQNQYVEAARVVGAGDGRIIRSHILPNVFAIILVGASIQVGGAILTESALAFLGYGVEPPTPSWGLMLNEAREELSRYPHLAIFPGLAIFFTVYSFNMLGDALRDVLDPRLRGSR
ncbi:MAG: ABC transporter permease [Dehalococcoidia bacterium]